MKPYEGIIDVGGKAAKPIMRNSNEFVDRKMFRTAN
jgi:hypothetical protein